MTQLKKLIPAGLGLMMGTQAMAAAKVGVMFSSYGDIDSPKEAEGYVKASVLDPDIAPIPDFLRGFISSVGWQILKKKTEGEYIAIGGGTNYRAASAEQAQLVADSLQKAGVDAKGYTGYVFTYPYIIDTMAKMQADGVTEVVVIDQGAQYSAATQAINIREANKYLAKHPEWQVKVTAVKSFAEDPRFLDLVAKSIEDGLAKNFADVRAEDVCLFLPVHGLPVQLPNTGDPAIGQMKFVVDAMRTRFPQNKVYIGFQNHDEFPGSKWTLPKSDNVAEEIASTEGCDNVLINGRVSFTLDNLETLFDEGISQREIIEEAHPGVKVYVEKMFNSEAPFVDYMKDVTIEALAGQGDIVSLR